MSNSNENDRNHPAPPSRQSTPPLSPQTTGVPQAAVRPTFSGAMGFGPKTGGPSPSSSPIGKLLPAVSAPKGGGALRGIGEKLELNPVTGTAGLSIPLVSVPGRNGPLELSLSYDSGAGNGPFGLGWQLSPPAISRRTDRGLPRYTDIDTFTLSGADDLVPDSGASSLVSTPNGDERQQRFRARIEGDYSRITRCRLLATGELYWTVHGVDFRGAARPPPARALAPAGPSPCWPGSAFAAPDRAPSGRFVP